MQKIHEWLAKFGSHEIYHADKIAADFTKHTGLRPCWPVHTAKKTLGMIRARGLGGSYGVKIPLRLAMRLPRRSLRIT